MKRFLLFSLLLTGVSWGHVPAVLLPLKGTPIASYFLGNAEISRGVYSELTETDDFFVAQFLVNYNSKTRVEILTAVCENIPQYELYQPTVFLVKGDLPWKKQGESNADYIKRLKRKAIATASSDYPEGKRPQFFERFESRYYWVGGIWKGDLWPGVYSMVVYDPKGNKGTFTIGLNEKESWTPDLYAYVGQVLPTIQAGICNPKGYSGKLNL